MTGIIIDDTMEVVLARMKVSPPVIDDATHIRRQHLTPVGRDECPAINLLDGDDLVRKAGACQTDRGPDFIVRIIVRGDGGENPEIPAEAQGGITEAYTIAEDVLERVNPGNEAMPAYPAGVTIDFGAVRPAFDVADNDVVALDLHFSARYTAGAFSLKAPTGA